ncbi:DUF397 domain-containing protein [Streptomyces sp. NPDC126499]|uniref:DUF397 domain-containing protein n=1 Tax=Streptomyces sp. NPDC126499 TaxID=3155314 RepID=UPI00331BD1EA
MGRRARRKQEVDPAPPVLLHDDSSNSGDAAVHVRDSKVQDGLTFAVEPSAWSSFLAWQG